MGHRQKKVVDGKTVEVGSFVLDRSYGQVGRIKRSTGTKSSKVYRQILDHFNDLYETGNHRPLIAVRDGKATPLDVLNYFKGDRSAAPPWETDSVLLIESFEQWLDQCHLAPRTVAGYRSYLSRMQSVCDRQTLRSELPQVVLDFRKECVSLGLTTMFNRTKAACQSYVKNTLGGKQNRLYQELSDVPVIPENTAKKGARNNPFTTPLELVAVTKSQGYDKRVLELTWFMCLTGCGPKEFLEDGYEVEPLSNAILIKGQKRKGRVRRVPLIYDDLKPEPWCGYGQLSRDFQKMFPGRTLYDCRRTFRQWIQRSGIPTNHANYYMGHSKSVDETYLSEDVTRWLREDFVKLDKWLDQQLSEIHESEDVEIKRKSSPFDSTDNLHEKPLDFFREILQRRLDDWYASGVMRRYYLVELIDTGESRSGRRRSEKEGDSDL
jgi:hypothetical protein